jgi:hypothetical protein
LQVIHPSITRYSEHFTYAGSATGSQDQGDKILHC